MGAFRIDWGYLSLSSCVVDGESLGHTLERGFDSRQLLFSNRRIEMSYPCSRNTLGKTHRMGGIERVEVATDRYEWRKVKHPNPDKINFRRTDPRNPRYGA